MFRDSSGILRGMKNDAVPHRNYPYSAVLAGAMAAVLTIACLLALGATPASAAKRVVGKDGRVYACYKTAGKQSGAVRIVPKSKKCRRGERKLNWSVAGPTGAQGQPAQSGGSGGSGANGSNGSDGSAGASGIVKLESQLLSLSAEVDLLKGILSGVDNNALTKALDTVKGITNADLNGVLGKLEGVTGGELQEAVAAVPAVELLCGQADTLTDTLNALRLGIGNIEILGVKLPIGGLPGPLTEFTCPA